MEPSRTVSPSLAEVARTAAAAAHVASVWSGEAGGPRAAVTVVRLTADNSGIPILLFRARSPLAREVATESIVTVSVAAPNPFSSLMITGAIVRDESIDSGRHTGFRVIPADVRLNGIRSILVPLSSYLAAEPDPLVHLAPRMLQHLTQQHGDALVACVRAHGLPTTEVAIPRVLDRYGLELALVTALGVTTVRLAFPDGPVDSLAQVSDYLRIALTCRCQAGDTPLPVRPWEA